MRSPCEQPHHWLRNARLRTQLFIDFWLRQSAPMPSHYQLTLGQLCVCPVHSLKLTFRQKNLSVDVDARRFYTELGIERAAQWADVKSFHAYWEKIFVSCWTEIRKQSDRCSTTEGHCSSYSINENNWSSTARAGFHKPNNQPQQLNLTAWQTGLRAVLCFCFANICVWLPSKDM